MRQKPLDYIPMPTDGHERDEILKFTEITGVGVACALGHLQLLWSYTGRQCLTGHIPPMPDERLARLCLWLGDPAVFARAILECHWVSRHPSGMGLWLEGWEEHAGKVIERRAKGSLRKAKHDATKRAKRAAEAPQATRGNALHSGYSSREVKVKLKEEQISTQQQPAPAAQAVCQSQAQTSVPSVAARALASNTDPPAPQPQPPRAPIFDALETHEDGLQRAARAESEHNHAPPVVRPPQGILGPPETCAISPLPMRALSHSEIVREPTPQAAAHPLAGSEEDRPLTLAEAEAILANQHGLNMMLTSKNRRRLERARGCTRRHIRDAVHDAAVYAHEQGDEPGVTLVLIKLAAVMADDARERHNAARNVAFESAPNYQPDTNQHRFGGRVLLTAQEQAFLRVKQVGREFIAKQMAEKARREG